MNANPTDKHPVTILVVDDDRDLCRYMSICLQRDGWTILEAYNGAQALDLLRRQPCDVLLTDIMMPDLNGVQLMKQVREIAPLTAVLLITGVPSMETAVDAVNAGALGYLLKPVSPSEILRAVEEALGRVRRARVMSQLLDVIRANVAEFDGGRRGFDPLNPLMPASTPSVIKLGGIDIYRERYQIGSGDAPVDLTPTEFDLLLYLAANRGRIVPCAELVEQIRGYRIEEDEAREVIRPHVSNLRRKLKQVGLGEDAVINVRGIGYRLSDQL